MNSDSNQPRPGFDSKGRRMGRRIPVEGQLVRATPKQHLSKKDRRRLKEFARNSMVDALNRPSKPLAEAVEEMKKTFEVHAERRTDADKALADELRPELPQPGDDIRLNIIKTKVHIAKIKAHKEKANAPSQESSAEEGR